MDYENCNKYNEECLTCPNRFLCWTGGFREPDYDLVSCLKYNSIGIGSDDIKHVAATIPGENDEWDWFWVVLLKDGRYALITGGCDYTGWD